MSSRDDTEEARNELRRPFMHTGSWYRMGSRQSSMMGSSQVIKDNSISVLACVLIIALGPIQFGFTCGYSSPTQAAIIKDLGLTVSESLMIAAIPNIIGWLCISFAEDTSFLYMGRLLEGFGVGIISYTVTLNSPSLFAHRITSSILGKFHYTKPETLGYDYDSSACPLITFLSCLPLSLGTLPCIVLIPGLFFIPESPRWLAKMGMTDDFETSLQVLRGFETDITVEVNEIKRSVGTSTKRSSTVRFVDLKRRRYYFPLMVGIGLLVLQQLGGINGVLFYSSTIFESAGVTSSNAATFGVGAIQVVATAISTWLVDKAGRRLLLTISSVGMTISLVIVAAAFYLKEFVSHDSDMYSMLSILSVVGVVAMVVSFSLGMGPIPWLIMSEILPVNIKGLAGSIATLANWFISWLITMTANLLLAWSSGGTFTLYGLICAFTVVFVTLWVPETKGKTLEELQALFR
ncbi:hypothetical protein F2Q69_00050278 [Brassica cretica]|uniref:Major facilitator superfamily (MFS) profile domain-containing protein n=1 Tax=Brassica cretica TaxID=69181 RepID=A0A8S9PKV8_BRACR|nr:hypothetical protein F2Q69_00050278 [Brassica cretica]